MRAQVQRTTKLGREDCMMSSTMSTAEMNLGYILCKHSRIITENDIYMSGLIRCQIVLRSAFNHSTLSGIGGEN